MEFGSGRNGAFMSGSFGTSDPGSSARSIQQGAGREGHRPKSILEPILLSSNGMSDADRSRRLVNGGMLPSANGRSASTYEKRQWLDSEYRTFG